VITKNPYCFQCGEDITIENNGICINENSENEMFQCDDCHFSEFGVYIWPVLLIFKKDEKETS
jgi:hypothetical protein